MRTSRRTIVALMLGTALVAAPALAFDGAPVNQKNTTIPAIPGPPAIVSKKAVTPAPVPDSVKALEYAAEDGHPIAQWKLGRMYAAGDGVTRDDMRAFEYFSRIADCHADDNPVGPDHRQGNAGMARAPAAKPGREPAAGESVGGGDAQRRVVLVPAH